VLFHTAREVIRNAAQHGRGADAARLLHLCVSLTGVEWLLLNIEDDGFGMAGQGSRIAAGHVLELHTMLLAIVGGVLEFESTPGQCTRQVLAVPMSPPDGS